MSSQADRLKAEGNALFSKGKLAGAYKKYTEAIKSDNENAILYSNRAACCLGLNRYLDACTDATKATDIDPGYAKAWGRLAEARMGLDEVDKAIEAWERALGALQAENLTAAEKKQRDQYNSKVAAAKAKSESLKAEPKKPEGMMRVRSSERKRLPWERAIAIIPELFASQTWNSSAWVIEKAYSSWEEAMNGMKQGRMQRTPSGPAYVGRLGAITCLSNALLEDSRVFHIADKNFVSMYNKQVCLEVSMTKAWSECGSSEVMQKAPKRLEAEGWKSVRPALSVTVRGWVVRAFIEDGDIETALDFYNSAMEVLEWGSERWKDVPFEEKGAIFQPTFIRGVKCLRLDVLLKACKQNPGKFPCEKLVAEADDLLSELADVPEEPDIPDFGFFLSFFYYPKGQAHSVRAFCLLNKAKHSREANGGALNAEISRQYMDASMEYINAAINYPMDDERHAWFLHCAYYAQFDGGTTLGFLFTVLDRLEQSVPMMKRIWEVTPQAAGRDEALKVDLEALGEFRRAFDTKHMQLDTVVLSPQPGMVV